MDIRALDLGDRSALAAAYAVECEATRLTRRWEPLGESARIAAWQADHAWTHRLVGAFEAGSLIGFASSAIAHDTPGTAWVNVAVSPIHQRRGVGTQLVRALEEGPELGRLDRFVASAYRPTSDEIHVLVQKFATPLGYGPATSETVVELDLVDADVPAQTTPAGYTVSTYVDGVPAGVRGEVGVLKGLVDAEAPHGDLCWQPTPVSPAEYQSEIDLWKRQGRTAIEAIATDDRGAVAGWTCLVVAADPARPAQIEGTVVLAAHRGRGLGRAVKVACLHAARDHGRATRVRTSSDDQNVWMRAINEELGFVPVEREVLLKKQRG